MALLDNIPGWKVFSTGIGIALLGAVAWFAYQWFFASADDLKELEEQALHDAMDHVAEIYRQKVREDGEQRIIVMPVRGKETSNGQVRETLMKTLNDVEGVRAEPPRDPEFDERATNFFKSMIDKEETEQSANDVFGKAAEADEVITLRVDKLSSTVDSGVCKIKLFRLLRPTDESSEPVVKDPVALKGVSGLASSDGEEPSDESTFWIDFFGYLWRIVVALLVAVALPFVFWPVNRAVFRMDSNGLNASLMAGLTAADLFMLWVLFGFGVSVGVVVTACVMLPIVLIYNLGALNFIEER